MSELWDLYNQERQKTGIVHERGNPVPQSFYHLVVSVWIMNSQGQYLISQRHPDKPYPMYWECTGGSVLAGESSLQGAVREVKEELGLMFDVTTAQLLYHTRRDDCRDFYDVWRFHSDAPIPARSIMSSGCLKAQTPKRPSSFPPISMGFLHSERYK